MEAKVAKEKRKFRNLYSLIRLMRTIQEQNADGTIRPDVYQERMDGMKTSVDNVLDVLGMTLDDLEEFCACCGISDQVFRGIKRLWDVKEAAPGADARLLQASMNLGLQMSTLISHCCVGSGTARQFLVRVEQIKESEEVLGFYRDGDVRRLTDKWLTRLQEMDADATISIAVMNEFKHDIRSLQSVLDRLTDA